MVVNESESLVPVKQAGIRKKLFFCRILQTMALTYFLILALLFLAGLIYSVSISDILSAYYNDQANLPLYFKSNALTGFILFLTASAGIVLFMLRRKAGFYIFFAASVVIFALDLSFLVFDWLRYLVHSGFIFVLGIAHFSKRCYSK